MISCNRGCGRSNLQWKIVNNKYKLFENDGFLHMCNDGVVAHNDRRQKATLKILRDLGISDVRDIPDAETSNSKDKYTHTGDDKLVSLKEKTLFPEAQKDPKLAFTINSTANGIAITGDDKHNAIYLPKIAISELVKALVDFI